MTDLLIFLSAPPLWAQAFINGIIVGSLFALAAYGMALVWGVTNIINVAQGEFVILGGYITLMLYKWGFHPLFGVPLAAALLYALGWALYKTIIFRVTGRDLFISLLATFGISIVIQQTMNLFFGPDVQLVDVDLGTLFLWDYQVVVPYTRLLILLVCALIAVIIVLFMQRTRTGQAIRATAQNPRAALVLGIDTEHIYATTFAINAALCGAAGALAVMSFTIHPYVGLPYTVRSFMIVILAGLGNLPGVIVAAMSVGVIEDLSDYILGAEFRLAVIFSLLVIILVWRSRVLARKREYLR